MNFIEHTINILFTAAITAFTVILFGALAKAWWLLFMMGWEAL